MYVELQEIADRLGVDRFSDSSSRPTLTVTGNQDERHAMIALPEDAQGAALMTPKQAAKLGLELVRLADVLIAATDEGFADAMDAQQPR